MQNTGLSERCKRFKCHLNFSINSTMLFHIDSRMTLSNWQKAIYFYFFHVYCALYVLSSFVLLFSKNNV